MEAELEAEQRRLRETAANMRKYERQYKEIVTQAEDDRRQVAELSSLVDQLTIKIKTYKRQIDEAVSIFTKSISKNVHHCYFLYHVIIMIRLI